MTIKFNQCLHVWDSEEYNPNCHVCGKRMRNDDKPQGEKCDCAATSCHDNCDRKHTHKKFFCEICEPEEIARLEKAEFFDAREPQGESDWEKELSRVFPLIDDKDFDHQAKIIKDFIKTERKKARAEGVEEGKAINLAKTYKSSQSYLMGYEDGQVEYKSNLKKIIKENSQCYDTAGGGMEDAVPASILISYINK